MIKSSILARREVIMPFFDLGQQPSKTIFPGVTITTAWGESLMMSFVEFAYEDASVPTHQHALLLPDA